MMEIVEDKKWMEKILYEEEVGHLSLSENGIPYVIPINYAYIDNKIIIHGSVKGKKIDIIKENPNCCFAVNRHPDRIKYHAEKRCHYRYHSVIVYGKAYYVKSPEERLKWIKKYYSYFMKRLNWIFPGGESLKSAENCGIIIVKIESITGRKEEGRDSKENEAQDKPTNKNTV